MFVVTIVTQTHVKCRHRCQNSQTNYVCKRASAQDIRHLIFPKTQHRIEFFIGQEEEEEKEKWREKVQCAQKGLLAPPPCLLSFFFLFGFVCLFCLFTIYPIYDFTQGFAGSVSWCGLSILISTQYEHVYSILFFHLSLYHSLNYSFLEVIVDLSFIAGQLRELNFYQHLKRAI